MKFKVWQRAEDELLLTMVRRQLPMPRIAARFGCTVEQIGMRLEELNKVVKAMSAQDALPQLPSKEQVAEMRKTMDPVQRAFMDMCTSYNTMGELLELFSTFVATRLAPEELEAIVKECFEADRLPDETIYQKISRLLSTRCILIPIMVERTTGDVPTNEVKVQ